MLDERGWVGAGEWGWVDAGTTDPAAPKYADAPIGGWYAPVHAPLNGGDRRRVTLFARIAPPWSPPAEVKVTEHGHAHLDELYNATPEVSDDAGAPPADGQPGGITIPQSDNFRGRAASTSPRRIDPRTQTHERSQQQFRRSSDLWTIVYGTESATLTHSVNLRRVAMIPERWHPSKPLTLYEVARLGQAGDAEALDECGWVGTAEQAFDREAQGAIRREYDDLITRLLEAEQNGSDTAESLRKKLRQLSGQFAQTRGLGGRQRGINKSPLACAKDLVTQSLRRAYR